MNISFKSCLFASICDGGIGGKANPPTAAPSSAWPPCFWDERFVYDCNK